ncbi:MAG: KH domain-containing protein [Thermocladium sp.]|jgi:ribosomal RNA assembly protein
MISDYLRGGISVVIDEPLPREAERILYESHRVSIRQEEGKATIIPQEGATLDDVISSKRIIEAINAGFPIEDALVLDDKDYLMEEINITDYVNKDKPGRVARLKGLIIGENGKAKRNIEELTETKINIKGSSIYIIGRFENAEAARNAIDMLLAGRQHSTVYRWLQKWRTEQQRNNVLSEIDEEKYLSL